MRLKKYLFIVIIIIAFLFFNQISFSQGSDLQDPIYALKYLWMTDEIFIAIETNAEKYQLRPALVAALIQRESWGNEKARGRAGERGLMQPLPYHYNGDPNDLYILYINIDTGCRYLQQAKNKARGDMRLMLMYYNGGLNRKVKDYKNWKYIEDILEDYRGNI